MKNPLIVLVSLSALLASCATVQQNIDARTYLAKCKYEFAGLSVTGVTFSSGILIDSVDLSVKVKVTNTTDRDVALDHADLSLFLDKNPILETAHKNFVRIAPTEAATEPVAVTLPFGGIVKTLGHRPEKIGVKAKLWVTLLVGKSTWETPVVIPVDIEVPIPYDQIDAFVAQKKKQLEDEALAQAKKLADEQAAQAKKLAEEKAAQAKKLADEQAAQAKKAADEQAAQAKKAADDQAAQAKKLADEQAAQAKKAADDAAKAAEAAKNAVPSVPSLKF